MSKCHKTNVDINMKNIFVSDGRQQKEKCLRTSEDVNNFINKRMNSQLHRGSARD